MADDNVVRLNSKEVEMAEEFFEKVKSGEVSHGIICYREKNGTLNYQLYAKEHITYILGMIERCKMSILLDLMED